MKKRFIILGIIILLFTSFFFLWFREGTRPLDLINTENKSFTIAKSEGLRSVASRLESEGIIRNKLAFFIFARSQGYAQRFQAGYFQLSPSQDTKSIAETLTRGSTDVWVTTLEGWRNEQIAEELTKELGIPNESFLPYAKEGYMFPDTYLIPKEASGSSVATIFRNTFDQKVTQDLIAKAKKRELSLGEVVTIASLIEREAKHEQDRPVVASVILNRLRIGMKLDIDSTIQYALGYQPETKTWWKKNLTIEDINLDSPYNTYTTNGLPPSPISNPGLAAINAVIEAPETNYLYYVSDDKGNIHPAKTIEEHNANIQIYVQK